MDYIKIEHVNKQFGKEHVLRDVNISFEAGKIHGLVGRNGCGKTTLLKLFCCELSVDCTGRQAARYV